MKERTNEWKRQKKQKTKGGKKDKWKIEMRESQENRMMERNKGRKKK